MSGKSYFFWTQDLQDKFVEAKTVISNQIIEGVKGFELGRRTALITDWSKIGIGYLLCQKFCSCNQDTVRCCRTGWKIVHMGSRFCSTAEQRYATIEGELLGVVWALEKTKLWTLGNQNLDVYVDHKPLVGLLTKRSLDDICNPRLSLLSEKTMGWNFRVIHIPGLKNDGPDCLS